ncbi:MAG TPA: Stk1 family PASTA domain-containing Ser/Thr kinase [Candidatus Limnocylindria bacterium]|nr:Stk1 family PASTA domain-containing Ser/Thr kinase [Candidatus Limnocylindria bacterium]
MTSDPGVRVIAGRYRLIAPVGEGGMATVWRAMDEQLGREVAVKILRPQFGADPGFAARFRNEARAAGALSHPNVVQVYDFGTDVNSGDQYIVMQLVEGEDLASILRERGPLEIDEAVLIGASVADALDAAHRAGLIHRDIKPGNILLTQGGRTLVTDFGISRAVAEASMTVTGTTIGSVHYFSPEQAAGEEVGPASDIYALGIVIYEMLSGRRPFEGESAAGVALKRLNEPPPPLSTGVRPIPAPLEAVVMRSLARDPAQRYPDAAAFSHALRNWRSEEETAAMVAPVVAAAAVVPPPLPPEPVPETAAPPPYIPPGPPPKKQRPWWVWALAILAVILLGAMGFLAAQLLGDGNAEPSPSAETFALPEWEGEPITQVRIEADDLGLDLRERQENDEDVPEDSVIRTQPPAGAQVSEGDEIVVFVSSGGETVEVPRLVGQTRDEANATLVQANLVLGSVNQEFSDQPEGTVIRSNPAEGTTVQVGDQVDIVLSRGPEPTPTPQPTPPPTPPPTPTPPQPTPSPT